MTQLLIIKLLQWSHVTSDSLLLALKLNWNFFGTLKLFADLDYVSRVKRYDVFGYLGLIFLKFLKINLGPKGLRSVLTTIISTLSSNIAYKFMELPWARKMPVVMPIWQYGLLTKRQSR